MRVGLLITGNEVLRGKTRDSNSYFICREVEKRGHWVGNVLTCGDDADELMCSLSFLSQRCDLILMTGGLGPTSDDLTSEVVARFFDVPVEFSSEAWTVCVSMFQKLGRTEIPESNKKQAMLPRGAVVFDNPVGTAAGFRVDGKVQGRTVGVCCLPGVPREMETMFNTHVTPFIPDVWANGFARSWQVFMLGESKLQSNVLELENDVKARFPFTEISYQAHALHVTYSLRARFADGVQRKEFEGFVPQFEKSLHDRIGANFLYVGKDTLVEKLSQIFVDGELTLALAESCTGGRVASEIAKLSGVSKFFLGGVVSYSNDAKRELLKVSPEVLNAEGAVSEAVAEQMAIGVREKFASAVALSITGVAGPTGGTERHPIGMVVFGLSLKSELAEAAIERLRRFRWVVKSKNSEFITLSCVQNFGAARTRESIQERSVAFALSSLILACNESHR